MDVGVNYPWFDYGWDFGDAPPGWRAPGSDPNWTGFVTANLEYFHELGVRVVRWFVFGDGLTYGSGQQAPQENPNGGWDFEPSDLSENFLKHFRKLVESFSQANKNWQTPIQLLPVLLDFHFCMKASAVPTSKGEWIKCGRGAVAAEPKMGQKFYDRALIPLLDIAKEGQNREAIFAWDIFNEPEWVTTEWHPSRLKGLPVAGQQMRQFIMGAMDRVHASGFKSTIGFARFETLGSTNLWADYNQFHYYAPICGATNLPRNKFDKRWPGIIGEFASTTHNDCWPELAGGQNVCDRLKKIDEKGYPLALIWSALGNDDRTSWGDAEAGIKRFLGKH